MKLTFFLNRAERRKVFLLQYYFGYGIFVTVTRIIVGPLLLLVGLMMIKKGSTFSLIYGGASIAYSFYYMMRPWLQVLFRTRFNPTHLDVELLENSIKLTDELGSSEINFDSFTQVYKKGNYVIMKMKNMQVLYFPMHLIEAEKRKAFEAFLLG
ncbi:MAG: YcxB family protein [Chitinophagales bacterium]